MRNKLFQIIQIYIIIISEFFSEYIFELVVSFELIKISGTSLSFKRENENKQSEFQFRFVSNLRPTLKDQTFLIQVSERKV